MNSVNILGLTYEVKLLDKVLIDGVEVAGKIDCEKLVIEICKHLADERKTQTLIHEIIHGILWETDRGMFHKENFVQRLACSIFQLAKENKGLFLF